MKKESFKSETEWENQFYMIVALLHPLTIEQNVITSFKSRSTLVLCYANSIGQGLFLKSDKIISSCDGKMGRGMQRQGMSLWITLHYSPDMWVHQDLCLRCPGNFSS